MGQYKDDLQARTEGSRRELSAVCRCGDTRDHAGVPAEIRAAFGRFQPPVCDALLGLRAMIIDTARRMPNVGPLDESLKWGQPAYRPARRRTGTTIRIDGSSADQTAFSLFVPCQTTLITTFKAHYPGQFDFRSNREIRFATGVPFDPEALVHCIRLALTYHLRKARETE